VDGESAELVKRWRGGDQQAAQELFDRYTQRLLAVVRARLSEKLNPRLDAEDVLQSAYRSFFIGSRDGRYVLRRSGDLWRLLVSIVLHKLHRQVEWHTAGKRAVGQEQSEGSITSLPVEVVSREPSPMEAAAVADELASVLRDLQPLHRQMVELRLQGHLLKEVAAKTGRSERMVRLVLEEVKATLEARQHG
jgi:RNA polymerase sigma-70 factor (ECF subfamily)